MKSLVDEMPDPNKTPEEVAVDDLFSETNEELVGLNLNDRCDNCGAGACSVAKHENAHSDLLFCYHDRNRHYDDLLSKGWEVHDDILVWNALTGVKS